MAPPAYGHVIRTHRLMLRPVEIADVERFVQIQSNWNVSGMLRMADYPPTRESMSAWLGTAPREWADGRAFRFAVVKDGAVIGCADIDEIADGWGDLGYWLAEANWGAGLATEAAGAVRDFTFRDLNLDGLRSGHAADNPASGKVLVRLGFAHVDDERRWSKPRSAEIAQRVYRLATRSPQP
jgi:ribosomal-protein-alanine N-acetyltransferase